MTDLLEPNITLTNNFSTGESPDQTMPTSPANLTAGQIQGPGSDETKRNMSISGNTSGMQGTNFATTEKQDGDQLADLATVPENGSSNEPARRY